MKYSKLSRLNQVGKNYRRLFDVIKNKVDCDIEVPINITSSSQIEKRIDEIYFDGFKLNELILKWMKYKGFLTLTKVQRLSIAPIIEDGRDVLVQSRTGSGKTLCFVLPMIEMLIKGTSMYSNINPLNIFSLIILPTRELAMQVNSVINDILSFIHGIENGYSITACNTNRLYTISGKIVYNVLLMGGYAIEKDIIVLNQAKKYGIVSGILVSTPGRVYHLIETPESRNLWTFKTLRMLVLDEADRVIEVSDQILSFIISNLPKNRITCLYSATLSNDVEILAKYCLTNPMFINADENENGFVTEKIKNELAFKAPEGLKNFYIILDSREKLHFLLRFLNYIKIINCTRCVIFFLTCHLVDYYFNILTKLLDGDCDIKFLKTHRKLPINKRTLILNEFRNFNVKLSPKGKKNKSHNILRVLLCTDIFSRGIDIPGIDWIIQYDPPQDPNFFIHRIGRACRSGEKGNALLFIGHNEESYVHFQLNRKITLNLLDDDILNSLRILNLPLINRLFNDRGETSVLNGKYKYSEYLKINPIMNPLFSWDETCLLLSFLRLYLSTDRNLLLSASKAFVSYIKAYSENRLKFIFDIKKLDYGAVATSFGVLRIPRVKEVLGRSIENFMDSDINPAEVRFTDEKMEEKRLEKLKEIEKIIEERKNVKTIRKNNRTRTEKRAAKRRDDSDWHEFYREEMMYRRLKKKRKLLKVLDDDDDDDNWEEVLNEFDIEYNKRI